MLALILILSCTAIFANATDNELVSGTLELELLSHGDIPTLTSISSDEASLFAQTREECLYELVKTGMQNCETSIELAGIATAGYPKYSTNNPGDVEELRKVIGIVINRNPELFYVDYLWGYSSYQNTGEIVSINPKYIYSNETTPTLEQAIVEYDAYISEVVDLVPASFTEFEKVLFVNDYFAKRFSYDIRIYSSDSNIADKAVANPYDFFKEDTGVCQAYTLAFISVMNKLGFETDACTSEGMNHTWNYIKLSNGKWYHIDVTWNDPVPFSDSGDLYGYATHRNFLLSDTGIAQTGHYAWNALYTCNDTTYDGVGDSLGVNTAFEYLDGKWYVTKFNSSKVGLYSLDDPEFTRISFSSPIVTFNPWTIKNQNGTYYTSASYSVPIRIKDFLIYNTKNEIYLYDGNTSHKLYTFTDVSESDSEWVAGFKLKNKQLVYQIVKFYINAGNQIGMEYVSENSIPIYNVSYLDDNGTSIKEMIKVDTTPVAPALKPQNPTKPNDENYAYTFIGWNENLLSDGSIEYVAEYNKTPLRDYIIEDGKLTLYCGSGAIAEIPEEATSISSGAFSTASTLTAIKLPNSITSIEAGAFNGTNATVYLEENATLKGVFSSIGFTRYRFYNDINDDKTVNVDDLKELCKSFAKGISGTLDVIVADFDNNGSVTLKDLSMLLKKLAS